MVRDDRHFVAVEILTTRSNAEISAAVASVAQDRLLIDLARKQLEESRTLLLRVKRIVIDL